MSDHTIVESLFSQLLQALHDLFSASEIAEVSKFVDVGEYGLALDNAVAIFIEERKVPTDDVIAVTAQLAAAMELAAADYSDRLRALGKMGDWV